METINQETPHESDLLLDAEPPETLRQPDLVLELEDPDSNQSEEVKLFSDFIENGWNRQHLIPAIRVEAESIALNGTKHFMLLGRLDGKPVRAFPGASGVIVINNSSA